MEPPTSDDSRRDKDRNGKRLKLTNEGFDSSEDEAEDEVTVFEPDYRECRRLTQRIKDVVITELGGTDKAPEIEASISRGRCSFTRSYGAPEVILQEDPTLKEYQVAAVHWLLTLYRNGYNGLLADDMGLGKSAESICFLKRLFADNLLNRPAVIAAPTTLLDNWMNELRKWAPRLKVLRYRGSQEERRRLMRKFETGIDEEDDSSNSDDYNDDVDEEQAVPLSTGVSEIGDSELREPTVEEEEEGGDGTAAVEQPEEPEEEISYYPLPEGVAYHVLVTSHLTLASDFDRQLFFKMHNFGILVVDEAHGLKNASSSRYRHINKSVRVPVRLLLTGSPIQNQISELKNLLGFLKPYRGNENFDINSALMYHEKFWHQAIEKEKEREFSKAVVPGLISNSKRYDTDLDENFSSTCSSPSATTQSSEKTNSKTARKIDPEILFYQQLLAPLILRRLKAEVIHNFPSKTSKIEPLDMHPDQARLYQNELRNAQGILLNAKGGRKRATQTAIKGLVFRLRRICNHPLLWQGYFSGQDREEFARYLQSRVKKYKTLSIERVQQHIEELSDFDLHNEAFFHLPALRNFRLPKEEFAKGCKTNRLIELVREKCIEKDEKILVFSQYTNYLDIIEKVLDFFVPEVQYLRLDGSTAVRERSEMVSSFQENTTAARVFLLSTKAGGVGLNLTSSKTVVLMDQDWNPHNDRQAEDRVHRLGQKGDVTVYRLCCRHSVEESVLSCCKKKLELDEAFGGVQEALPLEIFEEILRDAQQVAEHNEETEKKRESPRKVLKSNSDEENKVEVEPKVKSKVKKGVAKKITGKKAEGRKNARKTTSKKTVEVREDSVLLPGGDSD